VFAYGQTGCGKSYTMQGEGPEGNPAQRGIIPRYKNDAISFAKIEVNNAFRPRRSFEHIFEAIDSSENMKYLVHASYLEIYNENIRDLLGKDVKKSLPLKEHPDRGVYVAGKWEESTLETRTRQG